MFLMVVGWQALGEGAPNRISPSEAVPAYLKLIRLLPVALNCLNLFSVNLHIKMNVHEPQAQ